MVLQAGGRRRREFDLVIGGVDQIRLVDHIGPVKPDHEIDGGDNAVQAGKLAHPGLVERFIKDRVVPHGAYDAFSRMTAFGRVLIVSGLDCTFRSTPMPCWRISCEA